MAHLGEETLMLLALGESVDPRPARHVETCSACAGELTSLERVVRAGRAEPPAPEAPGPEVWAAIAAGLGLSGEAAADPLSARREDPRGGAARTGGAAVVDLDARHGRRRRGVPYPLAAAAAASALLLGGAAVWGIQRLDTAPEPTLLATAELAPLAGHTARGSAEVGEEPDGTRRLVVRTDPAEVEGFKEVWLLAPDAQGMVSLGVMAGDETAFVLPENLDVGRFPVVDVSDEPVDGDPTHSGNSLVRGTLRG